MAQATIHFLHMDWDASVYPPESRIAYRDLESGEVHDLHLRPGDGVSLAATGKRRCVGFLDQDNVLQPCPSSPGSKLDSDSHCTYCGSRMPLQGCRMCRGSCVNPRGRDWCVQPHVVYLTAYDPEYVKVGVSTERRWRKRIAEQGANLAIAALKARDGGSARRAEARVKEELGVTDKSTRQSRLSAFKTGFTPEALLRSLEIQHRKIAQLSWSEVEVSEQPDIYDLYTPYREAVGGARVPLSFSGDPALFGEVVAVKGWSLLVKSRGALKVHDLRSVHGCLLREGGPEPRSSLLDYL